MRRLTCVSVVEHVQRRAAKVKGEADPHGSRLQLEGRFTVTSSRKLPTCLYTRLGRVNYHVIKKIGSRAQAGDVRYPGAIVTAALLGMLAGCGTTVPVAQQRSASGGFGGADGL